MAVGRFSCKPVKHTNLWGDFCTERGRLICCASLSHRKRDESSSTPYHFNSIVTQPIRIPSGDCALLPLLDPRQRQAPFAVALELHRPGAAATSLVQQRLQPYETSELRDVLELRYLLAGCGQIVGRTGQVEPLEVGSSVLMPLGSAICCADPAVPPLPLLPSSEGNLGLLSDLLARLRVPPSHPFSMVSLVVLFHKSLLEDDATLGSTTQQAERGLAPHAAPHMSAPAPLLDAVDRLWGLLRADEGQQGAAHAGLPKAPRTAAAAAAAGGTAPATVAGPVEGTQCTPPEQQGHAARAAGEEGRVKGQSEGAGAVQQQQEQQGRPWSVQGCTPQRALQQQEEVQGEEGRVRGEGAIIKRLLKDLPVFELPRQTNRLALAFDPVATPQAPFVFGVETFQPGHRTAPHVHPRAHELFFILSGRGEAFCGTDRLAVAPGDMVVFDPGAVHGLDVLPSSPMYCLELMLPNDQFALEVVRAGRDVGNLQGGDMGVIAAYGCSMV